MHRHALAGFIALALLGAGAARAQNTDDLDRTIARAMDMWQVPGLAMAVTKGGRTVRARGYGVRDVLTGRPVTPKTLFATGSITKSFTVTVLAMQAEEGRMGWDRPVVQYLPGFRLYDDALTRRVTARDLVTHRTGMPRHDALWYLGVFDRAELFHRLRYLKPAAGLGSIFAYNNLMFVAAGRLAAHLGGMDWEGLIRARILAPLGMNGARLTAQDFGRAPNRASPYFPGVDGRVEIAVRDTAAIAPASAVYANAADMVRYVRFHLKDSELTRTIQDSQIALDEAGVFAGLGWTYYAMGFYLSSYRGRRLLYHPGIIDGFSAMISFMPGENTGMIVLSNLSGRNPVPRIVTYAAYDRLLGLDPLPWIDRYRRILPPRLPKAPEPAPQPVPAPRPDEAYGGDYLNPAYGTMTIRPGAGPGMLRGALHNVRFTLIFGTDGAWRVAETAWPLRKGLKLTFEFGTGARAKALMTALADGPTYQLQAGNLRFARQ